MATLWQQSPKLYHEKHKSYQNNCFLDAAMINPAASGIIQNLIVGNTYQLILIDQNGIPLCAAWNSK